MKKALQFALVLGVWLSLFAANAQTVEDLATVELRLKSKVLGSVPSTTTVQSYLSSLQSNGSWANIDYASTTQSSWQPLTHLDRLRLMCRAYAHPSGSLHGNSALLDGILNAYDFWISRNAQSTNWWNNEIAAPRRLGECMILIKAELSTARKNSGLTVLQRAYRPRSENSGTNTGQNRVDRAIAGIYRGIAADSTAIALDAFSLHRRYHYHHHCRGHPARPLLPSARRTTLQSGLWFAFHLQYSRVGRPFR